MRALLFTTGSPFARAVRVVLDELELDYERREEITTPSVKQRASATPTLQVPTLWDGDQTLWESGTIVEYLLSSYAHRPKTMPPLAECAFRSEAEWRDKLIFSTIQTFGNAATTISQMKWAGVGIRENGHLARSAEKLGHILRWLEDQLINANSGFFPDRVSMQDIFLAVHIRFVQARPLGIDLRLPEYGTIEKLLERLEGGSICIADTILLWELGVVGYQSDGSLV